MYRRIIHIVIIKDTATTRRSGKPVYGTKQAGRIHAETNACSFASSAPDSLTVMFRLPTAYLSSALDISLMNITIVRSSSQWKRHPFGTCNAIRLSHFGGDHDSSNVEVCYLQVCLKYVYWNLPTTTYQTMIVLGTKRSEFYYAHQNELREFCHRVEPVSRPDAKRLMQHPFGLDLFLKRLKHNRSYCNYSINNGHTFSC